MANITNVNELWGRKWRFKDDTPSPSEFSLRNSVTGVKFATFYLGEQVKDVYQTDNSVGNVGITTQGTFIRIGVSESSFTYAYAASGWVGKPAILEFIENTENYTLSCTNEENFITWFNANASEYVPPLNEWTKGVADAIREKKGTSGLIKPLDFAKEIRSIEAGGGVEINGLIEEYKVLAGENVSAGDFVEFVNNVNKELNTSSVSCYYPPSCVLLEENKVFIAHGDGSSYATLYGTIVEINGTKMTATSKQLNSSCNYAPSCVLLEHNKVFIAHSHTNSSSYLYGTIVEIDGSTMTATSTQLNVEVRSCNNSPSCVLLEENKIFIAHQYTNSSYLYGTIVEIDGTTMTATSTQLNSESYSCYYSPSCVLVEENKVFIAHMFSSGSRYLYGTIVTINETTMTSTSKQLNSNSYSCYYYPSCILLESNKVFIVHPYSSIYKLYGTIVEINGTTMKATSKQLNSNNYSCYLAGSCILLEPNKVFIAHGYTNTYLLYKTIVEINGTEMTATFEEINDSNYSCNNNAPSCVLLEPNKVFIAHPNGKGSSSYKYLYGTIYFGNEAKPTTSTIKGVAKTSGTGGDTIQVYVPNKE